MIPCFVGNVGTKSQVTLFFVQNAALIFVLYLKPKKFHLFQLKHLVIKTIFFPYANSLEQFRERPLWSTYSLSWPSKAFCCL